jgi:hypothetical protein
MWKIIILLFISSQSFALEYNDIIKKISVIKHYDNNVLVLNRGLEDAIDQFDHIKLTNRNGYIARAICTKSSMLLSYWKVYRVVNPDLLSYDENYTLRSMKQSSLPPHIKRYVKEKRKASNFNFDNEDEDNTITDKDLGRPVELQQDRIVKFDLANDVLEDRVLKEEESENTEFVERNFDSEKFTQDLSHFNISLFASPVSWQSQDDQKSVHYGFIAQNIGSKYDFTLSYEKNESKAIDQFSDQEVSSSSTQIEADFSIKRISKNWSYFLFVANQQATLGDVKSPAQAIQVGPLGFRYHAYDEKSSTLFNLSYVTTIDNIETERREDNNGVTSFKTNEENNARHMFRARFKDRISKKVGFESQLTYAPLINLDEQRIVWSDNKTQWDVKFIYSLSKDFSASYEFTYLNDIRRDKDLNLNAVNQINTFNLNYRIEI